MEGAVEKVTVCSKIAQFKRGTFTPNGGKRWTLLGTTRTFPSQRPFLILKSHLFFSPADL